MFWSGNFIVVRELNFLLKEENVTLSQVLEADDILQECKADNKALMQFLTRPDILAELITLITEEPPKNVELSQQYRHANIACEVLTSPLSMLNDRLSMDTTQMNRLCDFINRDPPLNPLLASYFSKTVEMLLERSPIQDWYLYHIVCLRVLDFFKARRDFLPNLLRHISTSAIADTFKYFIRLDDLFNKIIMEWLEENQFIECLIQIICGTYVPEELPAAAPAPEEPEKGQREPSEKGEVNHREDDAGGVGGDEGSPEQQNDSGHASPPSLREAAQLTAEQVRVRTARTAAVASANAAALLCDLVVTGCGREGAATRSRTSWVLASALAAEGGVRALLQGVFTSGGAARPHAIVNGCRLLLALLSNHPVLGSEGTMERSQVELAVAPHLPLLHQALLHDPQQYAQAEGAACAACAPGGGGVGAARVHTAALLAHLALSEVEEVPTTMITLGTPGVLVDMMFQYPDNNFLHGTLHAFCRNALTNVAYRTQYARHLLVECDLLTRLMDAFEDNENKQNNSPRSGYMGHVTLILSCISDALEEADTELARLLALPPPLLQRWRAFKEHKLFPALHQYYTPLGGSCPSDNAYEVDISDTLEANYDFNYAMATATMDEAGDDITNDNEMEHPGGHADSAQFIADGLGFDDDDDKRTVAKSHFLELASQKFDDDMWDDAPEGSPPPAALHDVLDDVSPWESGPSAAAREGWAQFEGAGAEDPFAEDFAAPAFAQYWPYEGDGGGSSEGAGLEVGLRGLALESPLAAARSASLANNLLTAMSAMSPAAIANLVNANLDPLPLPPCDPHPLLGGNTLPDEGTSLPGEETSLPGEETSLPGEETSLPGEGTNLPGEGMNLPDERTSLPSGGTSLPGEVMSLPGDGTSLTAEVVSPDLKYDKSVELRNLPGSPSAETSSPVDLKVPPVDDNVTPQAKHAPLTQPQPTSTSESPQVATEDSSDDRSELPGKANDISFVEGLKSQDSISPTQSEPKDSPKESVRDNAKVSEIAETPLEVEDAGER